MPSSSGAIFRRLLDHPNPWVRVAALILALAAGWAGYELVDSPGPASLPTEARDSGGRLERLDPVRLVPHRSNDGDSFQVRHGDRTFELRLYFVDSPETYLSDRHASQRERVADQAEVFGITVEEAVALGRSARDQVLAHLGREPFTVHTSWERVFDSERFYGFVELADPDLPGARVFLSEWLVRHGLARIHTKGTVAPDGRSTREFGSHLRSVESEARARRAGAWGL